MTGVLEPPSQTTAQRRRENRQLVLGIGLDPVTLHEAKRRTMEFARTREGNLVLTPNVDHVIRARRDAAFREICDSGDLVLADGTPLVWASRLLGSPVPERVAGSDLMPRVAVDAARAGLRFFCLGGAPGDAERAARFIAEQAGVDGLCGIDCPPMNFEHDRRYIDRLVARINDCNPDIVFVGLGSPKQETLMQALAPRVRPGVLMAVGISFSFLAGTVRRAPRRVQSIGLEWLWRLGCEPRRLWRRYAMNVAVFPWLVLRERIRIALRPNLG